jgi:hypothetical protein
MVKEPRDTRTVCTRCGTVAQQVYIKQGSEIMILLLLFFFIVPGVLYWLYCSSKNYWGCPRCFSGDIIPLDSPLAAKIQAIAAAVHSESALQG